MPVTRPNDNFIPGRATAITLADNAALNAADITIAGTGLRWVPYTGPPQSFTAQDLTRDGDWTMAANKNTSARPAPQPTGAEEDLLPAWTPTQQSARATYTVYNEWTTNTAGWLDQYGADVLAPNLGAAHAITLSVGGTVKDTFTATPTVAGTYWHDITPIVVASGTVIRVTLQVTQVANNLMYWLQQTGLFTTAPVYCSLAQGSKDGAAAGSTGYGCHVLLVPGAASPDWDVVAFGGAAGGGPTPDVTGKLDVDAVQVAATRLYQTKLLAGDAQPAFQVMGDGRHNWGPGGATAADTTLQRLAAATLNTPNALTTGAAQGVYGYNAVGAGTYQGPGGTFGSVRAATGYAFSAAILGDTGTVRFVIDSSGVHSWADGTIAAADTNLYRYFGGVLRTDGGLYVGTGVNALGGGGNTGFIYLPATAGGYAFVSQVSGEANSRFRVRGQDGVIEWGPGGATPVDTNLYRAAATVLKTDGAFASMSYGTTLPASAVNGQEFTLVDSTTNPTYQWRFRYNAGSTSAYKWEFIGGAPARIDVATAETTASTTAADLATVQSLTLARAGDYEFTAGAQAANNTAGQTCNISAVGRSIGGTCAGASYAQALALQGRLLAQAAASVCKLQFYVGGGTGSFSNRFFSLTPVRVA
jgi:hypothetical protein